MKKYTWVNETLERAPGSPGRDRLLGTLRQRYDDDIRAFNAVYQTSFESFDDLLARGTLTYPGWLAPFQFGGGQLPDRPRRFLRQRSS